MFGSLPVCVDGHESRPSQRSVRHTILCIHWPEQLSESAPMFQSGQSRTEEGSIGSADWLRLVVDLKLNYIANR